MVKGFVDAGRRKEWRNSEYLALKALIRLKPATTFAEMCKDSLHVGGSLSEIAWSSPEYYDQILRYGDMAEQATLGKELASLKLKTIVLGGDTKANHSGLPFISTIIFGKA